MGRPAQDAQSRRQPTASHRCPGVEVGVAGERQRAVLVKELTKRFKECRVEKNGALIRYDILVVLRRVHDLSKDEAVWSAAKRLMTWEKDAKSAKKYLTVWR